MISRTRYSHSFWYLIKFRVKSLSNMAGDAIWFPGTRLQYIGPHCTPPNLRPRPRPSLETSSNVFISAPFPTLLTSGGRSMYGWNVCVMYPTLPPPPLRQRKWPGLLFPWSCPVLILSSGWNSSAADTEVGQWEPKKPLVAKIFGLEGILPPCTLVFHFFVIYLCFTNSFAANE